jgi:PEP-CTERM motif
MEFRSLFLAALVLAGIASRGAASPIAYDFSGTLAQPINGSTAFSGTVSFESTVTGFSNGNFFSSSVGAHATVIVGGQSYEFVDHSFSAQGSPSTYEFDANSKGQGDNFTFVGPISASVVPSPTNPTSSDANAQGAAMMLHLGDPSGTAFPSSSPNLPALNLSSFSIRDLSVTIIPPSPGGMNTDPTTASGTTVSGTITSLTLEPQAVPEPTTLALFAMIGFGVAVRWKLRQRV